MLYAVLAHVDGHDVGIDDDGTQHRDLEKAQLYSEAQAQAVAQKFAALRPSIVDEERLFGLDFDEDDLDE